MNKLWKDVIWWEPVIISAAVILSLVLGRLIGGM
jgi:hypothetical protein